MGPTNGGQRVADMLTRHGVRFLFTLCGGHISPILVAAKNNGLRIVDVRHEANAVFAADAVARLTGVPGVAAVTAGPGLTNTLTAVENARLAQSPVVLLGGAAPTVLRGRGALQDIDQMSIMKPHVKWAGSVGRVREIGSTLEEAFAAAQSGVPGPVFVELPIDILYDEALVREWYLAKRGKGLKGHVEHLYLRQHLDRIFASSEATPAEARVHVPQASRREVDAVAAMIAEAERPLLLVGSQTLLDAAHAGAIAQAVAELGIPAYCSGMGRGLLGRDHAIQFRHHRKEALKESDLVLLAGVPADFRLDYGRHLKGRFVAVNRSRRDLHLNRRPDKGVQADPGRFLRDLAARAGAKSCAPWIATLRARDEARERAIDAKAREDTPGGMNPLGLLRGLDDLLPDDAVLVGDGGDFVAMASYTLRPRGPLSWLDPGVFGTLGVGAGFALGAKLCRPHSEVWMILGDGACAYSIAEYDTFVRHDVPVLGVVGNDASWAQIARDQVDMLHDDVGTVLARTDYEQVARGFGAEGAKATTVKEFLSEAVSAQQAAKRGRPFLLNAHIGKSDFRKGSISM